MVNHADERFLALQADEVYVFTLAFCSSQSA